MAEGVYGIAQQTKAETGRFGSINALKRHVFFVGNQFLRNMAFEKVKIVSI